ncbi:hypothetical protein FBEOM_14103, partial [Fusarium beomiforme]
MSTNTKRLVVWINGFPGTGKKTIADAMQQLYPAAKVFDNHKLIDPVAAKFSRDHPEYDEKRREYRQDILQKHVVHSNHDRIVIFTDFQSDNELYTPCAVVSCIAIVFYE